MRNPLCFLAALMLLASACSNTWPGPVPIDEALWDIELEGCGPADTNTLQWAEGSVTNASDQESPFYQVASKATFTDGTTGELNTGALIPPLEPGQAYDFRFPLANSAGKEVVTCEVWAVDSVSNYGGRATSE